MSIPPNPGALETMGDRPFSFYPPVVGVEHNEWTFKQATWSEILVMNTKSSMEVWVPRRFLGELSKVDEPVMIVGLKRELEYRAGSLWPHERRIIEMPKAVNDYARPPAGETPPPPTRLQEIRGSEGAESRIGRMIVIALGAMLLLTFAIVSYFRSKHDPTNVQFIGIEQKALSLKATDDYHAVIRALGAPKQDRWREGAGEMQYRLLAYPDQGISVILMGLERDKVRYIGALDKDWKPVHSVELPGHGNTRAMLGKLARF
ncbi:MAG: hypothetical protein JNK48_15455 [Bryobacterales bacterium]|nr:hypothetical protein [Bryobacterales bacterium]